MELLGVCGGLYCAPDGQMIVCGLTA